MSDTAPIAKLLDSARRVQQAHQAAAEVTKVIAAQPPPPAPQSGR